MGRLYKRKHRIRIESDDVVFSRGVRAVILELSPKTPNLMILRLKGTRTAYPLEFSKAFDVAMHNAISKAQAEKRAARRKAKW